MDSAKVDKVIKNSDVLGRKFTKLKVNNHFVFILHHNIVVAICDCRIIVHVRQLSTF